MKIIDKNGNDIIGTPNLKRGEEYQIQIDFTETIVDSYEEKMTNTPDAFALHGGKEGSRAYGTVEIIFEKVSFKNCKYKYGGAEIDLISSGNVVSNVVTLVEKKSSSSNKIATFELTGFNANDVQGGKNWSYHVTHQYESYNIPIFSAVIDCTAHINAKASSGR